MFWLLFFKFILGAVFGSFVAALTYRYTRNTSVLKGRSFCDVCKSQIAWYDNIPLVSFFFLLGKCRKCKNKISWRYPLIELTTAVGFVLLSLNIYHLLLFLILVSIFVIDFENKIIPDIFIFVGLPLSLVANRYLLSTSVLAGFICASFLLVIHLFTKGRGMGLGDVKFAILGGMIVGLNLSPIWLFVAFLTGAVFGIILILGKKAGIKSRVAFGPFLVISIPITLVWGQKIIDIVLSR